MRRWIAIALSVPVALAVLYVLFWWAWYPQNDGRSLRYTLWRAELLPMDLDTAVAAFFSDPYRREFVLGHSEAQLRARFGTLLTPHEAGPMLETCWRDSSWHSDKTLFIRKSWFMLVFDDGVATDLVLMKPC